MKSRLAVRPILLVGALDVECQTLRRNLDDVVRVGSDVACWRGMRCGAPVVVVRSGVGPSRVEAAIRRALGAHQPAMVLSCGIAGGLSDRLCVGDLILPEEVLLETDRDALHPDRHLLDAAMRSVSHLGAAVHGGRLLTSARVASTASEKVALAARHRALAVDMESAIILKAMRDSGVPTLVVRTISDPFDEELRAVTGVDVERIAGRLRILGRVVCHPSLAWELQRLRRNTACALDRLALALERVLPALALLSAPERRTPGAVTR